MDDSRLYQILGLRRGASQEEIKSAYRRLVKQLHPDLSHTPATSEQFKRVVRAYKVLSVRQVDGSCIQFPGGGVNGPRRAPMQKKRSIPMPSAEWSRRQKCPSSVPLP